MQERYCERQSIQLSQIRQMVLLDVSTTGQGLYYVEQEHDSEVEKYIVICDGAYHILSLKISGTLQDYEQISDFKSSYGWQ